MGKKRIKTKKLYKIQKTLRQTIIVYLSIILMIGSFSSIVQSNPNDPWWNTKWNYRKQITIPHTMVDQDLTNFPVLIDITSQDIKNHAQSNANDIVFTNQTGGKIYHYELESYDASNGHLIVWVNITQLSSTTDNILYLYYGNSTCGPQQNITGTWNSAFKGVYHLKETWSTTTSHFKDSTINHQDGTLTDANANSTSDTGIIGKGFHFNGGSDGSNTDFINIGTINHNYPITYSCWIKADTLTPSRCALGRYYAGYFLGTSSVYSGSLRDQILINNNWDYYNWRTGVSSNTWYLMTITYDGSTIRYYTNGAQDTSTTATGSLSGTTWPWHIGDDGSAEFCFKGIVDEVRIANTCLSTGWIATYYRNVNAPSSFYTIGDEETLGAFTLTLTKSGTGSGTIQVNPAGPYTNGTVVTIWANASIGSTFTGFSGNLTGTTTPQTLTMNGNKAVDAAFTLTSGYTLTLTTSGTGTGTIQAAPSGPYFYGDHVTIWANASTGSTFTGFTGNLTGTTTPQTLIIHGNANVNAAFTLNIPGPGNWWNTKWLYRKQITIPHTMVDQDLTNFPVLIDITSQDIKNHAQSNAYDIVFTNQTGGKIYRYELESYDASNGHLTAWVNITQLSSTTDNILYLYYGNSTSSPQQNITGTWNAAFKGVYHLKETWSTATGHFKDSTTNHQDGTLTDANANSTSDTGIIGKGFHFNGGSNTDYINIGTISYSAPITYSCWIKADNIASARCALGRYYGGYYLGTSSVYSGSLRNQILINNNWDYYNWRTGVSSNTWYLMTITYDGSTIRYYTNGAQDTSTTATGSLSGTTWPWHIGDDGNAEKGFKGIIDEVRITNTCLSTGWIATYYRNVNNPSTFYTIGSEETMSGVPPIISTVYPANASQNNVFNPQLQANVSDIDGDIINCTLLTNASGTWQILTSTTFTGSGTITGQSTYMHSQLMKYWWSVHCTDGLYWTNKTYWFKTGVNQPVVLDANPHNNILTTYNPRLSVNVVDYQNKLLTVKFRRMNGTIWQDLGNYIGYSGLYTQNTTGMNATNHIYHWSYNITDGTTWINASMSFTAQDFVLKWTNYDVAFNTVGPVAADVNNDSIYEIFQVGEGKVICVNGSTGNTIWTYNDNQIAQHSIPALSDLNNDGIPELVIACDEPKAGYPGQTLALHANNGSVFWLVHVPSDHRHFIIADIDGTGYPYVYVCPHEEFGYIYKLRGIDGAVLARTRIYYPCHGGLSLADMDNDGNFELILADYNGEPGKGIHCYDADTLKLKWYIRNRADPQIGILADVNKDGILDITTARYPNGPVQVIDGATASNIDGYSSLASPTHSPLTVYDIDGDGNLEALNSQNSQVEVFDLFTKSLDTTLPSICDEAPFMADVIGDKNLEIIAANYTKIAIYNQNYQKVSTINIGAERWTLVQDIDNDGQNELVTDTGGDGILRAYETSAYTPVPQVRTSTYGYSEKCTGAGVYTPPPGAPQPILKQETPANGSLDVPLNPTLSVHAVEYQVHQLVNNHIVDYHYDKMNITISTNVSGTWQTLATFTNTGNAQYNVTESIMNHVDTTYYWKVTAVDINPKAGGITTTKIYHFRTKSAPKIQSVSISPGTPYQRQTVNFTANITEDVHMDIVKLRITGPSGFTPVNTTIYQNQWTTLTYDNFETGWGHYTTGGVSCSRYQLHTPTDDANTWALIPQGNWAAQIKGNSGVASSFNLTNPIDIKTPDYSAIKVDFWMNSYRFSDGSKYYLEYFDGTQWIIRKTYTQNSGSFDPSVYTDSDYKFANWINFHDTVWINKSTYNFPTNMNIRFRCKSGSSTGNVSIDQIYINATVVQPTLYSKEGSFNTPGLYHYSFWCRDVNGNANSTATYDFTVQGDTSPPQITAITATPSVGYQRAPINISCSVQDNAGLQDVRAVVTDPDTTIANSSIIANNISPSTYYLDQIYSIVGTYQYYIWAKDVNGNTNSSLTYQFTVIADTSPPQITAVTATPSSGYPATPINLSCSVQDNIGLQDVRTVITDPNNTIMNFSIIANTVSPSTYYSTQTYPIVGTYQYYIWAKDINGNAAASTASGFTIIQFPPLSNWQYRKQITISHAQVSSNLTNFPVVIDIHDDAELANKAQESFNDVLFTDSSISWQTGRINDRLAHEIESCNGVSGNLTAWVLVPSLSTTQDTVLYMYYGNTESESQQQPTLVWSDNYVLVQHLNETSGTAYDSTSHNNDGTVQNNVNQIVTGVIDGADGFDGNSSFIHVQDANSLNLGESGTIGAWINISTYKNNAGIIHKGDLSSFNDEAYGLQLYSNNRLRFYINNEGGDYYLQMSSLGLNTWYYIVGTWNSSGRYLYANGVLIASSTSAQTPRSTTGGINIGAQITEGSYYPFDGVIDEVRVSSVSRNDDWIHTSYLNQVNPASFISVGSEETY